MVYETWCMTCHEADLEAVKIKAGDGEKLFKNLRDNIKMHKYIGDTSLSIYERLGTPE